MTYYKLGWNPAEVRNGDLKAEEIGLMSAQNVIPSYLDLRADLPANCYDQGPIGSCTANVISALGYYHLNKSGKFGLFNSSRLFIYYNERFMENTVNDDAGASLRSGMISFRHIGIAPEAWWWCNPVKFRERPNQRLYAFAGRRRCQDPIWLNNSNLDLLRMTLATFGPFVFGLRVYQSFYGVRDVVPMPVNGDQFVGGHAMLAVGYDESRQCFLARNSWTNNWGNNGHCWIPYAYINNEFLTSDCWTTRGMV